MKCDKCGKNNATTHVRTVVNGVVVEKNLCNHCAALEGYTIAPQTSLAGMLASMFGDVLSSSVADEKRCPVCNATFNNIAENGKVGCAECYKTFGAELIPYLKRVHGSIKHVGKIPGSQLSADGSQNDKIERLREELNRFVAEEKYEQAALIRDEIKKLEGEK